MSARLATERQWPVAVDGAVHVHDAHTGELLAIHEQAPDYAAEVRRLRAAYVERTALVWACHAELLAHAEEMRDDLDHPLRPSTAALLRRIAAEVCHA